MPFTTALLPRLLVCALTMFGAGFLFGACSDGYGPGESCDPTLGGRDCQEGLECTYSYDDCPQYGCPKCRRPCRADADCPTSDTDSCGQAPRCIFQQRTDFSGVCQHCDEVKPWL